METVYINSVKVHQLQPFLRQLFVSSTAWTFYLVFGLSVGTPTVTIPQLRKEAKSPTDVSEEMASWITSIVGYVGMMWVLGIIYIAHQFGRKVVQIIASINMLAASLVLYCSKHATHVLISQILHGMTLASQITTCMVLTEYLSPKYRGVFITIKQATLFWGIWIANTIGTFFDFRFIGLLSVICSIYNIIATYFIPESPYWLASKEKYVDSASTHRWLKGNEEISETELEVMISTQREFKRRRQQKKSITDHIIIYKRHITEPEVYKPVANGLLVSAMYHLSGKLVCTVYSIQIIKEITSSESTAYIGMLILDGVTVLAMYIGSGLVKFFKRRTLLLSASAIGLLFSYATSIYLYLVRFSIVSEDKYVTLILLTGFSIAICCGPIVMVTPIYSELIPIRSRNFCFILIELFAKLLIGTTFKMSPYMFTNFGYHGTFLFYAIASTICYFLVYKFLPETKDKTLHEIAEYFKKPDCSTGETEVLNKNSD